MTYYNKNRKMKTNMIVLFIICFALGNDAYGQIQRRPAPKKTEKQKIRDETLLLNDYNFDIKLGNVGFFRNLFLSSKINGGYKFNDWLSSGLGGEISVSYTHLRAHETVLDLVCRLLLEKKKQNIKLKLLLYDHSLIIIAIINH